MTRLLLHLLSKIDEPLYSRFAAIANSLLLLSRPEKVRRLGSMHPEKTFYVADVVDDGIGLAGWFDRAIGRLLRAKRMGWELAISSKENSQGLGWHSFFHNTTDVPFDEVMQSRNVVFANPSLSVTYKRLHAKSIFARHEATKSLRLLPEVRTAVENVLAPLQLCKVGGGMIGAYLRGTDYRTVPGWKPVGHAIVPDAETFCRFLEADCSRWGVDAGRGSCFFFVTEEQELLDALLLRWPEAKFIRKPRFSSFRHGTSIASLTPEGTDAFRNNLLYLADLVALSRCDRLSGPLNGGMMMALNLNGGKYKDVDIINLGTN